MNGTQQFVGAGGIALLLINFWTGTQRKTVSAGAFNSSASGEQTAAAHGELIKLAGELVFVGVATLLAGMSGKAGAAMAVLILALFVLWSMNRYSPASLKQK